MSYRVPQFNPVESVSGLFVFFSNIFTRWSNSHLILHEVLDIPAWNMASTASIDITYPVNFDYKRVIGFQVAIFNDDDSKVYSGLVGGTGTNGGLNSIEIDANNVTIVRKSGGIFDSVDFNDGTKTVRGKLTLCFTT